MNDTRYELGELEKGQIIEVQLSGIANVELMDQGNYMRYRDGKSHKYYGGHNCKSPYRIVVPKTGEWYMAIDLGGCAGRIYTDVHVYLDVELDHGG